MLWTSGLRRRLPISREYSCTLPQPEVDDMISELLGVDVGRMTSLAQQWGCVPRTVLDFTRDKATDSYIEKSYRRRARTAVLRSQEVVDAAAENTYLDDVPSQIFFCQPQLEGSKINRMLSCATVPTKTIRRLLGEALQHQHTRVRVNFFNALRQSSQMSQAAGVIFENWFLSFFSAARTIQCNWVQESGVSELKGRTTVIYRKWEVVKVAPPPYFWIAPPHFPGIDCALILDTGVYVFQVTIRRIHKPPMEGMKTLRKYLPRQLKNNPWSVVFVGDYKSQIRTVAKSLVGKIPFPTPDGKSVPIAWSVVNPMRSGIAYKVSIFG